MQRNAWVVLHRWAGLYMALFLAVAGLTGSVIAFYEPLDEWLNPVKYHGAPPDPHAPRLDPVTLYEKALALAPPQVRLDSIGLESRPGRTIGFLADARTDPATGRPFEGVPREFILDPHSGRLVHVRQAEQPLWPITSGNVLDVIYRLHYSLALPGAIGTWLFGIAAIVWTLDCWVGLYLTFPIRRRSAATAHGGAAGWWRRWRPAWLVRWRGGSYRLNFDLHRAGSLWVWLMLLVLAWSSVGLNLGREVYDPVMSSLFDMRRAGDDLSKQDPATWQPALGWREALARVRTLAASQAVQQRFELRRELDIGLDRERRVYVYRFDSSADIGAGSGAYLYLDADSGALRGLLLPDRQRVGPWLSDWLFALHMASVWGQPMKVFICAMGLVVAMLSVTGVYLWLRKRAARRSAAAGVRRSGVTERSPLSSRA